jgi:hypothetical protein
MAIGTRKAGTVVRCPKCSGQVVVPAASEMAPSVTPPPPTSGDAPSRVEGQPTPVSPFEFSESDVIVPRPVAEAADEPFDVVPVGGPGSISGYFVTTANLVLAGVLVAVLLVLAFFVGWFAGRH